MKARGWIILGLSTAVLVGACAWGYNQYKKLMDYCFNFTKYSIKKLGLQRIVVDLFLNIKNKSSVGIKITDYSFDIYVNDVFVSKVIDPVDPATGKPKFQPLPGKQFGELTLSVDFDPRAVFKAAFSLDVIEGILLNFENVKFRVSGTISVNGVKKVKVPDIEFTLKDVMPAGQPSPPCE